MPSSGTRTFDIENGRTGTVNVVLGGSAGANREGGLIKDGLGTLKLTQANVYTGTTTIKAGTLELALGSSLAGDVNVDATGTLGGTGTINGDLFFDDGAKLLVVDIMGSLNVSGLVSFGGFSISKLTGLDFDALALNTPYTLISGNVDLLGVDNVGAINAQTVGSMGRTAYFKEGSLQLVVIPEPATFGIVLGVLAAAVIRRRRFG
jgi:autotransporter-associated beta strand protein